MNEAIQDLDLRIRTANVLFFDLDGTLVDTNFANYLSYKKAILSVAESDVNIPYNTNERFNRGVLKSVIPKLTESEYERIIQEKEQYYKDYLPQTKLNELFADILIRYSKTNRTVLVTNSRKDRPFMTLNYYGLIDKFSDILYRQMTDNEKRMNKFESAISCLNIPSSSVIVFENEKSEINDAILAGIPTKNILSL